MLSSMQNLLILAGIVLLGALGYYLYQAQQSAGLINGQRSDDFADVQSTLFLRKLTELQSLEFDTNLFKHERLQNVVDFSQAPTPLPVGKLNPFVESN